MNTDIEKINVKLVKTDSIGIFHDSRKDIRALAKIVNVLIEKVNQLIDNKKSNQLK